jgi:hypothetical protein
MAKKAAQNSGATATAEAPRKPAEGVNKAQAIAEAFRHLGRQASGADVIGYVVQKFGISVSPNYVSIIRGNLKKKRGGRPRQAAKASDQAEGSQASRKPRSAPAGDLITLIREVKALAQRVGSLGELKRLVDALAE